jgi:hypothetical protein
MRTEFNIRPAAFEFETEVDETELPFDRFETLDVVSPGRILTYTTRDVIDQRISVPAQHSLVRLSRNPPTNADAVSLLEAVKAGRLGGIFCVNWQKPAQRAIRLGKSWWTVIPSGEDAVLMLDPDNPLSGQPFIAFRRELDPDCGLLSGEQRFASLPSRLDAALRKAWAAFERMRSGQVTQCQVPSQDRPALAEGLAGQPSPAVLLANVAPPILCQVSRSPGRPVVAFANDYPNPHADESREMTALNRRLWEPSTDDFAAIASRSGTTLHFAIESLEMLLNVLNGELPGSISRLFLIGHSSPTTFSFSGRIGTTIVSGRPRPGVTFDLGRAINPTNLEAPSTISFIRRNQLENRFAAGGEIVLFGCHSGTVRRGGTSPVLLDALSKAFKVCASGFNNEICSLLVLQVTRRGGRIIGRRISERGWLAYDPTGLRSCRAMLDRKFFRTVSQLAPDVRSCVGVSALSIATS